MSPMISWNRLEPSSRSAALDSGLRAEVHDPLWLLTRQWQTGEFQGEDASSPLQVWLQMDATPLTRYLAGPVPDTWKGSGTPAVQGAPIDPSVPLEVVVEREAVRATGRPRLAAEAGQHFLRLLDAAGLTRHRAAILARFPLAAADGTLASDPETQRFLEVVAGRAPDGTQIAEVLNAAESEPSAVPQVQAWQAWLASLPSADQVQLRSIIQSWRTWYNLVFAEPRAGEAPAWVPQRLEYQFAVAAPAPTGEVVLTAPSYASGDLDWYTFDVWPRASLGAVPADTKTWTDAATAARLGPLDPELVAGSANRVVLATPVRYPGMPVSRYWEFEDARVDFGAISAGAQQLAQLVLIEFAILYSDDWFVIPVDLPVGSLARVRWLVVADAFGQRTLVPAASAVDSAAGRTNEHGQLDWDMFSISADVRSGAAAGTHPGGPVLFLAPSLGPSLKGPVLEEVVLLRDELANMAWAVERNVESPIGRPLDRSERFFQSGQTTAQGTPPAAADRQPQLAYRLANPVPGFWLPLYPQLGEPGTGVHLRRAGLPLGRIMADPAGGTGFRIPEEEIPSEGARVRRAFQYARWNGGQTYVWVGRMVAVGYGVGSSGLRFDIIESSTTAATSTT